MKVIFLDHDGVICLAGEWGSRFKNKEGLDSVFDRFNEKAIDVLNEIIEETDCEIVVSSDWRLYVPLEQMQELYRIRGIKKPPIDYTPEIDWSLHKGVKSASARVIEINQWLDEHPEVTNWVAVDDMWMGITPNKLSLRLQYQEWGLKNFVHTPHSYEGIKQSGVKDKIIKLLL